MMLGLAIVRRCGLRTAGSIVFAVALFAFGSPLVVHERVFLAVHPRCARRCCGARVVRAPGRSPRHRFAGAGAACGIAFWSKPNVGVLVTGAVTVFVVAVAVGNGAASPSTRWPPWVGSR
jgi:4-amino-4-deoxy-L-arabinose transferase-like glycosyltransferase